MMRASIKSAPLGGFFFVRLCAAAALALSCICRVSAVGEAGRKVIRKCNNPTAHKEEDIHMRGRVEIVRMFPS